MDGNTYRYLVVEAEGTAVQSDWEFIATLDFLPAGTVIRKFKHDITIPDRYYHTEPIVSTVVQDVDVKMYTLYTIPSQTSSSR